MRRRCNRQTGLRDLKAIAERARRRDAYCNHGTLCLSRKAGEMRVLGYRSCDTRVVAAEETQIAHRTGWLDIE